MTEKARFDGIDISERLEAVEKELDKIFNPLKKKPVVSSSESMVGDIRELPSSSQATIGDISSLARAFADPALFRLHGQDSETEK